MTLEELQTLLVMIHLLKIFQPGLLDDVLAPLQRRVEDTLHAQGIKVDVALRVRLIRIAARPPGPCFNRVAAAALQRRRLSMNYSPRSNGNKSKHEVSPQHLLYYRDEWHLDAWCHRDEKLQTFDLDRIEDAKLLDTAAIDVPESELKEEFEQTYGILSGPVTAIARLRFPRDIAAWIEGKQLHPAQKSWITESGDLILEIPYGRPDELILDILRYGPDVEVLDPPELREAVAERVWRTAELYPRKGGVGAG